MDCFDVIQEDIKMFSDKDIFIEPLYQRVAYVVLAIAMNTYFHPENKDSVFKKINKFVRVIKENDLFSTSVFKCTTTGMDKQRKLTLMFIRLHIYFMLPAIGWLKQYYLKRGKYNY